MNDLLKVLGALVLVLIGLCLLPTAITNVPGGWNTIGTWGAAIFVFALVVGVFTLGLEFLFALWDKFRGR